MQFTIIICTALVCLANIECGTIKNLVRTAASEINKIADVIENTASKATYNSKDNEPSEIVVSNASSNVGNVTGQTVSTNVIISDTTDTKEIRQAEQSDKKVQVNIEINLVVNYQTDPNNVNTKAPSTPSKDDGLNVEIAKHQTGADNTHVETSTKSTDNSSGVDKVTDNVSQNNKKGSTGRVEYQYGESNVDSVMNSNTKGTSSIDRETDNGFTQVTELEMTTVGAVLTNPNVVFPGPSNKDTREDSGVVVVEVEDDIIGISNNSSATATATEKIEIVTGVSQVVFPDTAGNRAKAAASCPEGQVMTEKGYCLMPIDGQDNRINGVQRMAFHVGCFEGYARALDGSCQPVMYD